LLQIQFLKGVTSYILSFVYLLRAFINRFATACENVVAAGAKITDFTVLGRCDLVLERTRSGIGTAVH